jgi:transcriptional regulator with XRE-family HTH domain
MRAHAGGRAPYKFNWLKEHLPNSEEQRVYAQEIGMLMAAQAVVEAMEAAHLSRAELAKRIGKSKGFVSQVLSGSRNMTMRTLGDFLWACNREIAGITSRPLGQDIVPYELMDGWLDCEPISQEGEQAMGSSQKSIELRVETALASGVTV